MEFAFTLKCSFDHSSGIRCLNLHWQRLGFLSVNRPHVMKTWWGGWGAGVVKVYAHTFLTSALDWVSGHLHASTALSLRKERYFIHWTGK
jgi:hypothetical protein